MTTTPYSITVTVLLALLGAKELWRWIRELTKSNEKIKIKKLDNEQERAEHLKEYYENIFSEFKEKYDQVIVELKSMQIELHKTKIDLEKANNNIEKALSYLNAMKKIAVSQLKHHSPETVDVLEDLSKQVEDIKPKTKNKYDFEKD